MGVIFKRFCILIFLLLWVHQSRADFYYFFLHKEQKAYRINTITWNLERLKSDGKWLNLSPINFDSATFVSIPRNVQVSHVPSEDIHKVYFSVNCTNQFYVFDLNTKNFSRMDKTFFRGDNCHSYHFFRKGVLHSVGGYGFWRTNNHIIYFDKKSKEWEAYSSTGTPPLGVYGGFVAYLPEKDELISFMNYSHDINLNNGAFYRDKSIYSYSFKNNQWAKIGEINSKVFLEIFDKMNIEPHNGNYFTGKYFIMPAVPFAGYREFYAIDPRTMEMFKFKDDRNRLTKFNINQAEDGVNTVLRNREFILNIRPNQSENDVYIDGQLENMDALFLKSSSLGFIHVEIWYNSGIFKWFVSLLLIFLGIWWVQTFGKSLFFKRFKYANQIKFSRNLVDEPTYHLLKRLVETYSSGGIDMDETNSILGLVSLGHDAQRYKRSAMVKEANVKLALLTNCSDTIQRQDSSMDRRQKRYMINPMAINSIKEFLKP